MAGEESSALGIARAAGAQLWGLVTPVASAVSSGVSLGVAGVVSGSSAAYSSLSNMAFSQRSSGPIAQAGAPVQVQSATNSAVGEAVREAATGAAVGAGVGAGLWGLAMPVANFIGFRPNGIAAGSTAASWMSSAAIANGGSIAAGSPVAIGQRIGAVGLATPVGVGLVAAGVMVGGTVFGVKKLMSRGESGEQMTVDGEEPEEEEEEKKKTWVLMEWLSATAEPIKTTFTNEKEAREAFANSFTRKKQLLDPDMFCIESSQ